MTVEPGELVAVVGENGAGKSTLIGCATGVVSPDGGRVSVLGQSPAAALRTGEMAVVWQDLALCDNLSVIANIFLGRELGHGFITGRRMQAESAAVLARVGLCVGDLQRRVGELAGGERQAVAIARALLGRPKVLVLDEPTSALGVNETLHVERLLRSLRGEGVAVLLVSHRIDQVFGLADRVIALRHGRLVGDFSTVEVHADDVLALMSGMNIDSVARRHLARLSSLVDQLAEVEPSASLPMIISAMSTAFGHRQLCVHLGGEDPADPLLLSASVGIGDSVLRQLKRVRVGARGGPIGRAAASGLPVVEEDLRSHDLGSGWPVSMWSVPIQGSGGRYGVLSGLADVPGRPQDDLLRLASVYASLAATAIERERLLNDLARRNRVLEALRGVLNALAGPEQLPASLEPALRALAQGLRARAVALVEARLGADETQVGADEAQVGADEEDCSYGGHTTVTVDGETDPADLVGALVAAGQDATWRHGARQIEPTVCAVPFQVDQRRFVIGARWTDPNRVSADGAQLLESAARSLRLAVEREAAQRAQAEAGALRRAGELQRDFIHRLSHELRTPLTTITGYASTLRATDLDWDPDSTSRFLDTIATEAMRLTRLVGDLLDTSAISAGVLRMQPDWCEVAGVLEAAIAAVSRGETDVVLRTDDVPPVWADHDRLEQVFVNLLDNVARHGGRTAVVRCYADDGRAVIEVTDGGPGIPAGLRAQMVEPYVRGDTDTSGAGLGLAICKGIIDAHGGSLRFLDATVGTTVQVVLPLEPDARAG
ncbi:ATP-binding cassette domain-containing protein [Streptomyces spongiae]|uniref:histidine kinase n=2 Tax=Streptomyces spongiae TaxID=565072 RepID=A0A5N8XPY1_9ACTN|nr:ATP-binding cassette domain-containing protein [Streptomyces spongiae]